MDNYYDPEEAVEITTEMLERLAVAWEGLSVPKFRGKDGVDLTIAYSAAYGAHLSAARELQHKRDREEAEDDQQERDKRDAAAWRLHVRTRPPQGE